MHRFCIIPLLGGISRSVIGCKVELKIAEGGPGSRGQAQTGWKSTRLLLRGKEKITKNILHFLFFFLDLIILIKRIAQQDFHSIKGRCVKALRILAWF